MSHSDQRKETTMKTRKQEYIDRIRSNTAYSIYRTFVRILTLFGYVLAATIVVAGVVDYTTRGHLAVFLLGGKFLVGCIVVAAITVFFSRLWKEAAVIFADIADSITDANSRSLYEQ